MESTAKVGPCRVVLQTGHTVRVTLRRELWKWMWPRCSSNSDRAGLESISEELLQAKMRLKYDHERMQSSDCEPRTGAK